MEGFLIDPFRAFRQTELGLYVPPMPSPYEQYRAAMERHRVAQQAAMDAVFRPSATARVAMPPDVPTAFLAAFEEGE